MNEQDPIQVLGGLMPVHQFDQEALDTKLAKVDQTLNEEIRRILRPLSTKIRYSAATARQLGLDVWDKPNGWTRQLIETLRGQRNRVISFQDRQDNLTYSHTLRFCQDKNGPDVKSLATTIKHNPQDIISSYFLGFNNGDINGISIRSDNLPKAIRILAVPAQLVTIINIGYPKRSSKNITGKPEISFHLDTAFGFNFDSRPTLKLHTSELSNMDGVYFNPSLLIYAYNPQLNSFDSSNCEAESAYENAVRKYPSKGGELITKQTYLDLLKEVVEIFPGEPIKYKRL